MQYLKTSINKKDILQKIIKKNGLDALMITSQVNRLWYTNCSADEGALVITPKTSFIVLDGRFITVGQETVKNVDEIKLRLPLGDGGMVKTLEIAFKELGLKKIGFESEYTFFADYEAFSEISGLVLKPVDCTAIRIIKTNEEIALIEHACEIGDHAYSNLYQNIKVGMKEKDLEKIVINTFLDYDADKPSFDTIIASGVRGAMPHGVPTTKTIERSELVTMDLGCIYKGYCSDTTRTISLNEPTPQMRHIFDVVFEAQRRGCAALKPGVTAHEVDKVCRDYITEAGYGEYFIHTTGHGVGIEVHELPWIEKNNMQKLEPGMVVTVEPGIYIPQIGGVRIEDTLLITETGHRYLSKTPHELHIVNN